MIIIIELDSFLNIICMLHYIFAFLVTICKHFCFFKKLNVNFDNNHLRRVKKSIHGQLKPTTTIFYKKYSLQKTL